MLLPQPVADFDWVMLNLTPDFFSRGRLSLTKVLATVAALNLDNCTPSEFAQALIVRDIHPATAKIQYSKARQSFQ